jgi:hypothetical protein
MMEIAIPVLLSLFLGPGVGQLYNREYKKGSYLIGLSLFVVIAAVVWFQKAAQPYLPSELPTETEAVRKMFESIIQNVIAGHGRTLLTYQYILLGVWVYSVVDAYRGAIRKRQREAHKKTPVT